MWIIQRLLIVIALAVILLFGMLNAGEVVKVHYWYGAERSFEASPLPLVMIICFLVGVLFYYLISIPREWRLRAQIRRLRKDASVRDRELTDLRNLPLEEDMPGDGPVPDREG